MKPGSRAGPRWLRRGWLLGVVGIVLLLAPGCRRDHAPLLIIYNADIHTVDPARPRAQAMAIEDGRIVALGSDDEVMALAGRDAVARDAEGHTVIPGLIDGHVHLSSGLDLVRGINLYGLSSKQEWLRIIAERADDLGPGEWLVGGRWDHTLLESPELPTREDLDRVVDDSPVALTDADGRALWVNSVALELAGIDASTPDPRGGRILRRPESGEPTGILLEASSLVTDRIPDRNREQRLSLRRESLVMAARLGITTVHDIGSLGVLEDYRALRSEAPLPIRVWFGVKVADGNPMGAAEAQALAGLSREVELEQRRLALERGDRGPGLALGYVERVLDGVLSLRTAALLEPYTDAPLELGMPRWSEQELESQVVEVNRAGLPVAIHANGDLAVRMSLDAIEAARSAVGPMSPANRIEHIEVVDRADAERFASLGVPASMNPHHRVSGIGSDTLRRLGPDRAAWAFAWERLQSAGAELIFGSDWPTGPLDPMRQLAAALVGESVTEGSLTEESGAEESLTEDSITGDSSANESLTGTHAGSWLSENRLSWDQVLRAYTLAGAEAAGWSHEVGSLEVGKWADFAILDRRLEAPFGRTLLATRVEEAFVAGQSVSGRRAMSSDWQVDPLPAGR